jgi:hypothetical protein
MRPVILLTYVVMALWLLVAAVLRVLLSAANRVPVDGLPVVTGGLGLLALLILVPTAVRGVRNRTRARPGRDVRQR